MRIRPLALAWMVFTAALLTGGTASNALGPPTDLTASVLGNIVTLTWRMPSDGDPFGTYAIEAGSASGLSDLANFNTGSSATTLTASAPRGRYFVRVRAITSAGLGPPSNEVVVDVDRCSGPPGAPLALTGAVSGRTVMLNWTAPPGIPPDSYIVDVGSAPGSSDIASFDTRSPATSLTATAPTRTYDIRIRARNGCGISNASNEIRVTVRGTRPIEFVVISEGSNGETGQGSAFVRNGQVLASSRTGSMRRGFSIAAVNPTTGELLAPVATFDTWGTRNSGTAMNAMANFIESIPNGTLLLIAVHDEAGLTLDSFSCLPNPTPGTICCQLNSFSWTQRGVRTLEAIGARDIRRYCYRNSYGLIAIKGEGAMAEQLINATRAIVRFTLFVD